MLPTIDEMLKQSSSSKKEYNDLYKQLMDKIAKCDTVEKRREIIKSDICNTRIVTAKEIMINNTAAKSLGIESPNQLNPDIDNNIQFFNNLQSEYDQLERTKKLSSNIIFEIDGITEYNIKNSTLFGNEINKINEIVQQISPLEDEIKKLQQQQKALLSEKTNIFNKKKHDLQIVDIERQIAEKENLLIQIEANKKNDITELSQMKLNIVNNVKRSISEKSKNSPLSEITSSIENNSYLNPIYSSDLNGIATEMKQKVSNGTETYVANKEQELLNRITMEIKRIAENNNINPLIIQNICGINNQNQQFNLKFTIGRLREVEERILLIKQYGIIKGDALVHLEQLAELDTEENSMTTEDVETQIGNKR